MQCAWGRVRLQVSLLSSGPAVVNLMFSLPAGRWLGRRLVRQRFGLARWRVSGIWYCVRLPWIARPVLMPMALLALLLFVAVPNTFWAVGFNALFADTVAPEHRGFVVGRRVILGISQVLVSLLCGAVLSRLVFPLGYQIVFVLGAVGGGLSIYHLGRVQSDDVPRVRVGSAARSQLAKFGPGMRSVEARRSGFLRARSKRRC